LREKNVVVILALFEKFEGIGTNKLFPTSFTNSENLFFASTVSALDSHTKF
jgi:hypothetical protein